MSPDIRQPRVTEQTDVELAAYRSISGWAVAGLVIGLLSPLALVDPLLWAMPIAAGIVCVRAFSQIRQNAPAMIGRKAALAGLWLAVFSFSAAYGDWLYYRWRIRDEARQTALFWFELLAQNRPELAFQLTLHPQQRRPFDERIWDFYVDSEKDKVKWFTALKNYVAPGKEGEPASLVRTLLALGDSADVRYLGTLDQFFVESQYVVDQLFAVTFTESGGKKTFFVSIRLARIGASDEHAGWRIVGAQGGVDENGKTTT
ncbi:MAG: hypothetical protein ABSA77_03950 [Thermoguttaceae bacterium]|jgi:hypothetical protein